MRFITDDSIKQDVSYHGGLNVIAAGLSRCATSTTQYVLENDLGYGPCMHMANVVPYTSKLKLVNSAMLETDKTKRQQILHELFAGFQATADFPGMLFIDDLVEMYPDAKLILNLRNSPAAWQKSIKSTLHFFCTDAYLFTCYLISTDYWHWRVHQTVRTFWNKRFDLANGPDDATKPDSIMVVGTYDRHNNWVRNIAKKNGTPMLEWKPEDGWEPLCEFLDRPVPQKPLPRMNDRRFIQMLKVVLVTRGLLTWALVLGAPVFAYWAWARYWKA